jgi:hypothetical protein
MSRRVLQRGLARCIAPGNAARLADSQETIAGFCRRRASGCYPVRRQSVRANHAVTIPKPAVARHGKLQGPSLLLRTLRLIRKVMSQAQSASDVQTVAQLCAQPHLGSVSCLPPSRRATAARILSRQPCAEPTDPQSAYGGRRVMSRSALL